MLTLETQQRREENVLHAVFFASFDTEELMAFENIGIFNEVAKKTLENYDFGANDDVKLLVLSENATYLVFNKSSGNYDGVLRVSRPGYHTLEELQSEMKWLKQINEYTPLIVANPIPSKNGDTVQQVKGSDGNTYFCVICEYLTGKNPVLDNEEQLVATFKYLGETTAYLHRQTEIWNGTKTIKRIDWNFDTIIGKNAAWGDWRDYPEIKPEDEVILNEVEKIIEKRLKRYGKTDTNYGLIHADLRHTNILIDGDQIKVIDFDDCGFGWHLHDLAAALSLVEEKPYVPKLVNAWLDGYKKVLPFTDTDFEEIDTFIMMRRLQFTAWLASHADSDPAKEVTNWMEGTMQLAERYKRLFG